MNNEARTTLERIAHVLNTAQVRWEGDTVMAYISALVTAGLSKSVPSETKESADAKDAARYRWLRGRAWPFTFKGDTPESADAAIDEAMELDPDALNKDYK